MTNKENKMGLIRLLVIAALIFLAWRVVKNLLSQSSRGNNSTPGNGQDAQAMLKCDQCGVHVPAPDAFTHNGRHFCSQEHQRLYLEHHDR
ncbi:MAG: PP0621 family protein [Alcanivorax sp.]|uniref:PP0621 family protein n=1 Tax=Alcanivorax sp. TaxID=1872427 RepID=UPI003DA77E26